MTHAMFDCWQITTCSTPVGRPFTYTAQVSAFSSHVYVVDCGSSPRKKKATRACTRELEEGGEMLGGGQIAVRRGLAEMGGLGLGFETVM